ncbi:hypothetical protein BC833DRAFT_580530 [Globomyces pollinis-pini]|nr:hypothetical protein BC833DRAFT_580530 [Globomyces pollinis-pini]
MRDKENILRSSCMSCDCVEYQLKRTNRCGDCSCLVSRHRIIDELPGTYSNKKKEKKNGYWNWFAKEDSPLMDLNIFDGFLSIKGIESITLEKCQKQIAFGIVALIAITAVGLIAPSVPRKHSLFGLYFNTTISFFIVTIMALRSISLSRINSKKVILTVLMTLNLFMSLCYLILAFGMTSRLATRVKHIYVESARYIAWLVVYPTLSHLIGDFTTNTIDMKWTSRLVYLNVILMFLSHFAGLQIVGILCFFQVITFVMIMYKYDTLFSR